MKKFKTLFYDHVVSSSAIIDRQANSENVLDSTISVTGAGALLSKDIQTFLLENVVLSVLHCRHFDFYEAYLVIVR